MSLVFVLSSDKKPLDPCHPARARKLLKNHKAAIFRYYPFTIILQDRVFSETTTHGYTLKIDPGSKATGITIVRQDTNTVVWAAEIEHRGQQIHQALQRRSALRRSRRQRKTRYRKPRFNNRRRTEGWLAPSLTSRVYNILTWVERLRRYCPITGLAVELVKFDTQLLQNPDIKGVEYCQGTLAGYELREYLLEKWHRTCAYCGDTGIPLQIEHVVPKTRGGSNRVSNLCLACEPCNQRKGNLTAAEFGYPNIQSQAKLPLKDAAAVNITRWALWKKLKALGLELETSTGGRTKYNRTRLGLPKEHWIDAACVGKSGEDVKVIDGIVPLLIQATGRGRRQRCRPNKYGFPIGHAARGKHFLGWQTGDIARANIPTGKYAGRHVGRIAIRHRPSFQLNNIDIHPKYLVLLQQADGYAYNFGVASLLRKEGALSSAA